MIYEEILAELRKLKTEENDLQKFGITMALIFLVFADIASMTGSRMLPYMLALATIFAGLATFHFCLPALKKIYIWWMTFALALGYVMTRLILSLMFYTMFLIGGVATRLLKKDIIDQTFRIKADSYWKAHEKVTDYKKHLERQF